MRVLMMSALVLWACTAAAGDWETRFQDDVAPAVAAACRAVGGVSDSIPAAAIEPLADGAYPNVALHWRALHCDGALNPFCGANKCAVHVYGYRDGRYVELPERARLEHGR